MYYERGSLATIVFATKFSTSVVSVPLWNRQKPLRSYYRFIKFYKAWRLKQKTAQLWTSFLWVYAIAIHAVISNSFHNGTAMHQTSQRILVRLSRSAQLENDVLLSVGYAVYRNCGLILSCIFLKPWVLLYGLRLLSPSHSWWSFHLPCSMSAREHSWFLCF